MRLASVMLLVLAAGCAPQVAYDYDSAAESRLEAEVLGPPVDTSLDILELTPAIQAHIDAHVNPRLASRTKLKRLRELLFDEDELNIRYEASSTLTATETWDQGYGNCLSMTTLFIAAARHVGLDARYRTVKVEPTWDHEGRTMIRYEHIVASGHSTGGGEWVVDFLPEFVIGDQPTIHISDAEALSLYYNNLGAEALVDGDPEIAKQHLRHALQLRPDYSDAWNNMGAVQRRLRHNDLAEFSYRRALHLDPFNYSALSNLAQFYKAVGREREARHFIRQVNLYRQKNPYFHYFVARLLFSAGEYRDAQASLRESIRLKRDEPDFYVAMAQTHQELGDERASNEMLNLAEKYRAGELRAPPRHDGHRFWNMVIEVNPN